jgi:hypothetical protein
MPEYQKLFSHPVTRELNLLAALKLFVRQALKSSQGYSVKKLTTSFVFG